IGMGAEWGVGASLVMEKIPPRYRGVVSGLLQQGYALGYLLAAVCYLFVYPHWGWRPLFFIGGLPALLALFVRARVRESDVWRAADHRAGAGGRGRDHPHLGIRARAPAPRRGRVHHAVLRPGRLGRDPRAPERTLTGCSAGLPARLRLPMRRGDREPDPARAGA